VFQATQSLARGEYLLVAPSRNIHIPLYWCPHRILEDKKLEEAFIGVNLEVSHFHILGYPVYIHVLVEKRTNLEPSNRKGLFIGYSETSKAYMVYILEQRKTIVSRDVKFEEDFSSRESH